MKQKNLILISAFIITIIFNACEKKEKDLIEKKINPSDTTNIIPVDTADIISYVYDTIFSDNFEIIQTIDSLVYHKYNENNLNLNSISNPTNVVNDFFGNNELTYLCPFLIKGTDSLCILGISYNPSAVNIHCLKTFKYKISYLNKSITDSRFEKLNENILESIDSLNINNICYVTTNIIKTEQFKEIKWEFKDYNINSIFTVPIDIANFETKKVKDTLKLFLPTAHSQSQGNLNFIILKVNTEKNYFEATINLFGSNFRGIFYDIKYLSEIFKTEVTNDLNNISINELFKIAKVNDLQKDFPKTPISVLIQPIY